MSTIIRLWPAPRPKMPAGLGVAGQAIWLSEMAKDRFRRLDAFQVLGIERLARTADRIVVSEQVAERNPDFVADLEDERNLLRQRREFLEATRREPWMPLERPRKRRR